MNKITNNKEKYLENIESSFLKSSFTIKNHIIYELPKEENIIELPIFNSEKAIFLKEGEKINNKKKILNIPLDSSKKINCNENIVFENKTQKNFCDKIYSSKKVGKNFSIAFDTYFFSKIDELKNYVHINTKITNKEKILNFKIGKSIVETLRMISINNKFISNQDWHFYTSSNFFLSILHSLKLEKSNYNSEMIKNLLRHFTGFEITVITSDLLNIEKNKNLLIGFFHHELSVGTVRKKIEFKEELIKLNIKTEILKSKEAGTIILKK